MGTTIRPFEVVPPFMWEVLRRKNSIWAEKQVKDGISGERLPESSSPDLEPDR
jgi:hypothetical protein